MNATLWRRRDAALSALLVVAGGALLVAGWVSASDRGAPMRQVTPTDVAAIGLVLATVGCAAWVHHGRHAVRVRTRHLLGLPPGLPAATPVTRPTSDQLVGAKGLRLFHRADCPLAAERHWRAAPRTTHLPRRPSTLHPVPPVNHLLPYLVVGVTSGSIYAIAGLGLVLTFKTSGVVNFAHGAQAALAAFVMFELRQRMAVPWPLAALIALLAAGVAAGVVLERLGQALASAPTANRVAATVGVLVAVQAALTAIFGSAVLELRAFLPTHLVRLPGVNVRVEQLIVAGLGLAAAVGLSLFFRRTRLGIATRAVVDDPTLAEIEGESPERIRRSAWIIGSTFAALSGILLAPTVGLNATTLTELVLFAFGAAAVGRFTSLPLTYAGGLGIGVGASLITKYLNTTGPLGALPDALPLLVLIAAVIVQSALQATTPTTTTAAPSATPTPRRIDARIAATATLVAAAIPFIVGSKLVDFDTALGFVIVLVSLHFLVRTSGQISLCHMALVAVGATTFARALGAGWPWPVALIAAGLVAAPVGALVALPAVRLSGPYVAVTTMAFGLLIQELVFGSFLMFGGPGTLLHAARPDGFGSDRAYYYVALAVTVACITLAGALRRSRFGRLLRAAASEPGALASLGTDTTRLTLLAFAASAFIAGIAGAVIAPVTGTLTAGSFDFSTSLVLVAVLFIGGSWPVAGPVIAAALYVLAPSYFTDAAAVNWLPAAFGIAAVVAATGAVGWAVDTVGTSKRTAERVTRHPARTVRVAS